MIKRSWNYILNHKWAKDIFRANLLFFLLIIFYNAFHFDFIMISIYQMIKWAVLMNLCLLINTILTLHLHKIRKG